jgi:hypothetical protein
MNYMDFDPYPMIRQRNEEMLREVHSLRLGERLRKNRDPRGSRLVALVQGGAQPLLRSAGLTK